MSVYVDRSRNPYGRMLMSHMIADTPQELLEMAYKIGVQIKWFQATTSTPHFDVCQSKRAKAMQFGAVELGLREYVEVVHRVRGSWPRGPNGWHLKQLPMSEE